MYACIRIHGQIAVRFVESSNDRHLRNCFATRDLLSVVTGTSKHRSLRLNIYSDCYKWEPRSKRYGRPSRELPATEAAAFIRKQIFPSVEQHLKTRPIDDSKTFPLLSTTLPTKQWTKKSSGTKSGVDCISFYLR